MEGLMLRTDRARVRMAAVGGLVAAVLAGPALADNERYYASAGARMSYGDSPRQTVPNQSTPASASVGDLTYFAAADASARVVGGVATASVLVPPARTDGLPYPILASARSGMTYSFHLAGENTGERVPVSIFGGASVNWVGGAFGEADVYLSGESGDTELFRTWRAISDEPVSGGVNHKIDETLFLVPGVSYDVQLYANVFATPHYSGVNSLSAYAVATADPVFTVLGDFADHYTIVGVPQPQTPVGGVPEPAAWALMLAGFAGLGAMLRARRRGPLAAGSS
jgi:hypothetical protein